MNRLRAAWGLLAAMGLLGACRSAAEPVRVSPRQEGSASRAPDPPPGPPRGGVGLSRAVALALENYPSIRASQARVEAAEAGIDAADTSYLPRVDLHWQSVRATRNNVAAQFFPQGTVPAIAGPVSDKSWDHAWGSMGGVLAAWEPFDFGVRGAQVDAARAAAAEAEADRELARLDAAFGAAEAFLVAVAAAEAAKAADANVERWDVFARSVKALVDRELRPGVDQSRAEAERALARNQAIQARQTVEASRATLAEALGFRDALVEAQAGVLLSLPSGEGPGGLELGTHPLVRRSRAAAETAESRREVYASAWAPRVNLLFSLSDRGSGFDAAGEKLDPADGLYPDRWNWAAGVSVTFALMDRFGLQARARQEEAVARAERARTEEIEVRLTAQERRVRSAYDAARKIAENTPVQLKAAQDAHARARTRYDAGLGPLTEVAEAQRLLAQAEIDDALARLGVWRALSAAARVRGDVRPFLDLLDRAERK